MNKDTYSWYLVAYVQNTTPCYSLPASFDYLPFPQMDCTLRRFWLCLRLTFFCNILLHFASSPVCINEPIWSITLRTTTSSLPLYLHPWARFEAAQVGHSPKAASHPHPFFYRRQRLCCQYSSSLSSHTASRWWPPHEELDRSAILRRDFSPLPMLDGVLAPPIEALSWANEPMTHIMNKQWESRFPFTKQSKCEKWQQHVDLVVDGITQGSRDWKVRSWSITVARFRCQSGGFFAFKYCRYNHPVLLLFLFRQINYLNKCR